MSVEQRIDDLIEAGWGVLDSDFDPRLASERISCNHKRKGRIMKRQLLKKSSGLFVVILFSLMSGVALAEKKHWFVVKDKNGVCKVIEAETVGPLTTIAGPFKTMKEAEKRKAKDCPKGAGQATEQLRPHRSKVSECVFNKSRPNRCGVNTMQREEPQQQQA